MTQPAKATSRPSKSDHRQWAKPSSCDIGGGEACRRRRGSRVSTTAPSSSADLVGQRAVEARPASPRRSPRRPGRSGRPGPAALSDAGSPRVPATFTTLAVRRSRRSRAAGPPSGRSVGVLVLRGALRHQLGALQHARRRRSCPCRWRSRRCRTWTRRRRRSAPPAASAGSPSGS